jgi:hypothetical protein
VAAYRKGHNPPNGLFLALGLFAVCGLATLASFQHPFTPGANAVTGFALVVMLIAQIVFTWRGRARRLSESPDTAAGPSDHWGRRRCILWLAYIPWIVLCMAFTALELLEYLSQPRQAHPTFSSLTDDVTSSQAGRAVLFLAWLVLSALLVDPRSRHRVPAHGQGATSELPDPQ